VFAHRNTPVIENAQKNIELYPGILDVGKLTVTEDGVEQPKPVQTIKSAIGVDLGLTDFLTDSNGHVVTKVGSTCANHSIYLTTVSFACRLGLF